jgi:CDP-glucose 4,6-dehydratase
VITFWKNRRVLITGAGGFKGPYLAQALLELGADVYGVVSERSHPDSAFSLLWLSRRIGVIHLDLTDPRAVDEVLTTLRPSVIFHLAAKALVPACTANPREAWMVNVIGTVNLLEASRRSAVERMIITSTDHVFGNLRQQEIPVPADRHLVPAGPYESSKAAAEFAIRSYAETYADEMPLVAITRCSNVFGLGDVNDRRVVPLFIRDAITHRRIRLRFRENGRSFLDAPSAVAGYIKAAEHLDESGRGGAEVYQFAFDDHGNGRPYVTMGELAQLVASCFKGAEVVESEGCCDFAPRENPYLGLETVGTRAALGWRPVRPFRERIAELCEWSQPATPRRAREVKIRGTIREALAGLEML